MVRPIIQRKNRHIAVALALLAATALAGCQQKSAELQNVDSMSTASAGPASYQAAAEHAKAWQSDPRNINKGMAYANALESLGQTDKQMEVYASLMSSNPNNTKLAGLYGRKLVAAGRSAPAIPILQQATSAPGADWRLYSALGSAYDQQGLYQKAREQYNIALSRDPDNLIVLNNLGMSHALEGNLKEAEATLRRADALPRSRTEPRIRQNLALVVGLQGRFEESRQIASQDLPAEQVEANMSYLQKMLAQPNTWQQISEGNG